MTIDRKLELITGLVNRAVSLMLEVSLQVKAEAGKCEDHFPETSVIQQVVADHFNLHPHTLTAKTRTGPVATARHIAMKLSREFGRTGSLTNIGRAFGDRDHSTVAAACTSINNRIDTNPKFAAEFQAVRSKVALALNIELDQTVSTK